MSESTPLRIRTRIDGVETTTEAPNDEAYWAARLGTREGRIAALDEAARCWAEGRRPPRAIELFLAAAFSGYLATPRGRLERDFLRVLKASSHDTVHQVWLRLCRSSQNSDSG